MIDIMLDLETWGTKPSADLRSIGACVFNPTTGFTHDGSLGTIRPFYIATDNPASPAYDSEREYPLKRDPQTVKWWSEQSAEAQAAFVDPVDLRDALVRFRDWLTDVSGESYRLPIDKPITNIRIWSHGAAFDAPILAAAYDALYLPLPWHYRAPRDTRTLFDAAGIDNHSAWLQQYATGTYHHALDDAICQARAACAAYQMLRA